MPIVDAEDLFDDDDYGIVRVEVKEMGFWEGVWWKIKGLFRKTIKSSDEELSLL